MTLSINNTNNICSIEITEDLTIFEVSQYHQTLLAECDFKDQIKLDLSKLEDIDTAGIQLILSLEKQVKGTGGEFFLQDISPEMDKVLNMFNLSHHFKQSNKEL